MTPEQAQDALSDYRHSTSIGGPRVLETFKEAVATVAAQTWEWGLNLDGYTHWMNDREMAEDAREGIGAGRIVRRLVGPVEVAE